MSNMYCVIDFETTGINPFRDKPIEIGAVLLDNDLKEVKTFHSYINPGKARFKRSAINISGVTSSIAQNYPEPQEVLELYFKTMGTDYRFVGWNISFDVTFMRRLAHKYGNMRRFNKINHRHIDIQTISYLASSLEIIDETKSFSDLITQFKGERSKNHNALQDAILTAEAFRFLSSKFSDMKKGKLHFH